MNDFAEFLLLKDANVRWVVLGCISIGLAAAITGTYSFLKKQSLVGDAVAHSILPGVCAGFLVAGFKDPVVMLVGSLISGWISLLCIDYLVKKTTLSADTAIAIVLSTFFALGLLMLTIIQHQNYPDASGLDHFLFGKAAALSAKDVWVFSIASLIIILFTILLYKPLKLLVFDPDFATTSGLPVKSLQLLLTTFTVVAVALGIQAVGVVLMAALLIAPPAIATYWTNRLPLILVFSGIIGMLAGWFGAWISWSAPQMPTGPWIVIILTIGAWISIVLAPEKGILSIFIRHRKNQKKIRGENVLKTFYHAGELDGNFNHPRFLKELLDFRGFESDSLVKGVNHLTRKGYLNKNGQQWALTEVGLQKARRIVRLHRLWELYLSKRMNLASDHVHHTAEAMEHIISPEMEAMLLTELDHPLIDPHQSKIPFSNE